MLPAAVRKSVFPMVTLFSATSVGESVVPPCM